MRRDAGFTLLEMLLTVAVLGVLTAVSVPLIAGALDRYELISGGQQVVSTIRTARFQSVARNQSTRVQFDFPAAGQYQTEVFAGGAWVALGQIQMLPRDVAFGDATPIVEFAPTGRLKAGDPTATISVSNGNPEDDRTITVSSSGRVQLQ